MTGKKTELCQCVIGMNMIKIMSTNENVIMKPNAMYNSYMLIKT